MKRFLWGAALAALLPMAVQAQVINPQPGFYAGAGGGIVGAIGSPNNTTGAGWLAGGKVGYDFVGPRLDLDVGYGQTPVNLNIPGTAINGKVGQLTGLVNLSYDFMPAALFTPYIGAGAPVLPSSTATLRWAARSLPMTGLLVFATTSRMPSRLALRVVISVRPIQA